MTTTKPIDPLQPWAVESLTEPPPAGPSSLKGILISESELQQRIEALAEVINADYADEPFVVVGVLTGTILFFADLVRQLRSPIEIDFIGISSYRDGTTSGLIETTKSVSTPLKGRKVLVVDDILDGGNTLNAVVQQLENHAPSEIKLCVLLERTDRRTTEIVPHYVGFRLPDYFVVGYGLDYAGRYRNLPYVGVLDESKLD